MCPSRETCLPVKCCFSDLACWSSTNRTSPSSDQMWLVLAMVKLKHCYLVSNNTHYFNRTIFFTLSVFTQFLCQIKYVIFYELIFFFFLELSGGVKVVVVFFFSVFWFLMSLRDRKDSSTITVCYILSTQLWYFFIHIWLKCLWS